MYTLYNVTSKVYLNVNVYSFILAHLMFFKLQGTRECFHNKGVHCSSTIKTESPSNSGRKWRMGTCDTPKIHNTRLCTYMYIWYVVLV